MKKLTLNDKIRLQAQAAACIELAQNAKKAGAICLARTYAMTAHALLSQIKTEQFEQGD